VSEKTLELNIIHELLEFVQRFDDQSFAVGLTLRQEGTLGYDSRILSQLPQSWRTAPLQFKRARKKRKTVFGKEYSFMINNNRNRDQHLLLYQLCRGRHNIAFYVFPLFLTENELKDSLPELTEATAILDVAEIPPYIIKNQSHRVLVYPTQSFAFVRSEEIRVEIINLGDLKGRMLRREVGLSIEEVRSNMREMFEYEKNITSKRPLFIFQIFK